MTFVLFFGRLPALRYVSTQETADRFKSSSGTRRTPVGALHRLLMIHIPRFLFSLDQKITNGRVYASGAETLRFVMNERHPTVLVSLEFDWFVPCATGSFFVPQPPVSLSRLNDATILSTSSRAILSLSLGDEAHVTSSSLLNIRPGTLWYSFMSCQMSD